MECKKSEPSTQHPRLQILYPLQEKADQAHIVEVDKVFIFRLMFHSFIDGIKSASLMYASTTRRFYCCSAMATTNTADENIHQTITIFGFFFSLGIFVMVLSFCCLALAPTASFYQIIDHGVHVFPKYAVCLNCLHVTESH